MSDTERSRLLGAHSQIISRTSQCYVFSSIGILLTVVVLILAGVLSSTSNEGYPKINFPVSASPMGRYQRAAVACDNGICSTIGKNIMQTKNGSAVDAAIAALLCNNVVNMQLAGLGGAGVAVIWDARSRTAHTFDGMIKVPRTLGFQNYSSKNSLIYGSMATGVPGHAAVLFEAHTRFGRLNLSELIQPAVDLCENGFIISPTLSIGIEEVFNEGNATAFPEMNYLREYLTNPHTGRPYKVNETLYCHPNFTKSLKLVISEGLTSFYNGTLADLLIEDFAQLGVPITHEDLLNYHVAHDTNPFELEMRNNLKIFTSRPPSGGPLTALILNIFAVFNFTNDPSQDPLTYHRLVESMKLGSAQLNFSGDEELDTEKTIPVKLSEWANQSYAEFLCRKINDDHTLNSEDYMGVNFSNHGSTTHISVLDEMGSAFSMTSSLNSYFGSYVIGPRTGIIFNNLMEAFRSQFPLLSPGRRPTNTLSPMIFVDETEADAAQAVKLIVGSSGAMRIMFAVANVASRVLFFNETVKEAVDAYRLQPWISPPNPDNLYHEQDYPQWLLNYLRAKGNVKQQPFENSRHSAVQAIQRLSNGTIFAISDFRRTGGYTAGF